MHGSVLSSFQKFATARFGILHWEVIAREAGAKSHVYLPTQIYPDGEALALFAAAARYASVSSQQLQDQFGEYLAPAFLKLYRAMIPPEWTTLDIAANSVLIVHRVIRMRNSEAGAPKWNAVRVSDAEVQITYSSRRGMCGLFVGVMRGFTSELGDVVDVSESRCTHRGDDACLIVLRRRAD